MKILLPMLLALSLLIPLDCLARATVPLQSPQQATFVVSADKAPTMDKVREAIGFAAQLRGWQVTAEQPGQATLHTLIRNKHDIVVNVIYDTRSVRIEYVSSVNMKYEMEGGAAYIHPNYNKWVNILLQDIVGKVSSP
jgi:hypothetical protein